MVRYKKWQKMRTRYRGPHLVFHRSKVSKPMFVACLQGSYGSKKLLAQALGVGIATIYRLLNRPDWADVRQMYDDELATAGDMYLHGLQFVAQQSLDLNAKLKACITGLKVHRPEYRENNTVTIEGGQNPIRTENKNLNIDLEQLQGLSIGAKREILNLIEAGEKPKQPKQAQVMTPVVQAIVKDQDVKDQDAE